MGDQSAYMPSPGYTPKKTSSTPRNNPRTGGPAYAQEYDVGEAPSPQRPRSNVPAPTAGKPKLAPDQSAYM